MDHEFASDEGESSSNSGSGESTSHAVVLTPTDILEARSARADHGFDDFRQGSFGRPRFGRRLGWTLFGGASLLALGVISGAAMFDRHSDVKQLEAQVHVLAGRVANAESRADALSHEGDMKTLAEKQATLRAEIISLKSKLEAANRQAQARETALSASLQKDARVDQLTGRIDRLEHQLTSETPTGSIAKDGKDSPSVAAKPAVAAATVAVAKAPAKAVKTVDATPSRVGRPQREDLSMEGFFLRGFDHGFAIVEDPDGVEEVAPGDLIPGVGRVQRIERRAGAWVVITDRGVIAQADY